ncbi:helix-turn-helix domain-containing protein [Myxococcota bacterium]|nr:helix-turn-helix domain-containing protein [Myxococcota bacterium]
MVKTDDKISTEPGMTTGRAGATAAEVAERFRVSTETVRRWARSGRVPTFRAGLLLRFDLAEVEAALRVPASTNEEGQGRE